MSVTAFRRPNREHAIALAKVRFLAGERVEMNALSAALDIGRTTLYRWVGEREQLIGEIFGQLVDDWLEIVEPQAEGVGVARFLDVLRHFLEYAAASEPLTQFTEREPALALRVLLDRSGRVAERNREAIRRLLTDAAPELEVPDKTIDAIAMAAVILVWAYIATGDEPDIDGAVGLASTLLEASASASSA
jgi:AcrR family transcriptional regulator